jgi:DNA-binding NarL/FixJ family response regulator
MSGIHEGERFTAVVVDDSKTVRQFLKLALQSIQIEVVGAGVCGEDILPLYERHRPTLMFADIVLPGIDGIEAVGQLLKAHPEALVVMCSSLSSRERALACQQMGVIRYLLKPCTQEKVVAVALAVTTLHRTRIAKTAAPQVA